LSQNVQNRALYLFQQVLTSTYFLYNVKFYDLTDEVTIRSPLAPGMANFYMENFEQRALNMVSQKSTCWNRYISHAFIVWLCDKEDLGKFQRHLNSIHQNIRFMIET
jgi:hypothetical protein